MSFCECLNLPGGCCFEYPTWTCPDCETPDIEAAKCPECGASPEEPDGEPDNYEPECHQYYDGG